MVSSGIRRTAAALRAKYLPSSSSAAATGDQTDQCRTAVVVGATSGIGEACAHRLAEQGYLVVAVGRDRPGRAESVVSALTTKSEAIHGGGNSPRHEFRACDAFSLASVQSASEGIVRDHESIDALILTQGMATTQGFTPTADGNDEKITLHYWSRIAFACLLLPSLLKSKVSGGASVLTVLSGGVHGPYKKFRDDPELKKHYSVSNAADFAGFYTDLGFDAFSRRHLSLRVFHAAPGFVNTNWGTEFPWYVRGLVRCMQPLGRNAADCAEYMLGPTVFASAAGDELPARPASDGLGLFVVGDKGDAGSLTKMHDKSSREFVWEKTKEVLSRSGINIE